MAIQSVYKPDWLVLDLSQNTNRMPVVLPGRHMVCITHRSQLPHTNMHRLSFWKVIEADGPLLAKRRVAVRIRLERIGKNDGT